jgi:hypothetical protein
MCIPIDPTRPPKPKCAIRALYHLVTRYPPNPSYLTTIHPIFILVSRLSRFYCLIHPTYSHTIPDLRVLAPLRIRPAGPFLPHNKR